MNRALKGIYDSFRRSAPKGLKTAWWLIKITIPVTFAVMLMDYFGILAYIAGITGPWFKYLGLPGVSAIVLITSMFTNVYSVVAVLTLLDLPYREGIILATMCLVSHGFIIETAVMKKTGSSAIGINLVRIAGSIAVALILNWTMPGRFSEVDTVWVPGTITFQESLINWMVNTGSTILKIFILVNVLLFFQQILEEFGWIKLIEHPLRPLMKIMGLPTNTTFSWVVANLVGLAYGSAIMIDQCEKQKMTKGEADLLNHHISISHSQLEDPLLFTTLGYALHWLIWPRVIVAIAAVWLRKGIKAANSNLYIQKLFKISIPYR
jgi:spore maturation protein SpmB